MTYSRGDVKISIEKIDGFGKNPGLWIGSGNQLVKVASFGSEDKAQTFCKWLEYLFGLGEEVRLRDGREGDHVQQGDGTGDPERAKDADQTAD